MEQITAEFIQKVTRKLAQGKPIRRKLPGNGLLHIDRPLPFLLVYRHPPDHEDPLTSQLVRSEASYLIAAGQSAEDLQVQALVQGIAQTLSASFGAFLIIELWKAPATGDATNAPGSPPTFRILSPAEVSFTSVNCLKEALEALRVGRLPMTAEILPGDRRHPPTLPPLLTVDQLKAWEGLLLGLEIQPFYLNPATGQPFPLVLRALISGLSKALKKTFFDFVRIQTTLEAPHFQTLGRQAVVRAVWEVDRRLAEINDSFKFLLLVTPINTEEAWQAFRESRFEKAPRFHYRLLPIDPEALKRQLYNIPMERVEDPTLAYLFRDKRHELDKMLTLLADRDTPDFLLGSQQLYGRVEQPLVQLAQDLLAALSPDEKEDLAETLPPGEFAELARREIDFYRQQYPEMAAQVAVQDDIVGLIVSDGNLYVGLDAHISRHRAEALLQHEVGTHILTYYNGKAQPLRQLYCGTPGYEELQEGLAVLSEYLVGGLTPSRLRTLAARVVAVQALVQGAEFGETFRLLHRQHSFDAYDAYIITMRVYRGGGLTKDAIYLKGLHCLLTYLRAGNDLEPLLIGKIRESYIPHMQELIYRRVLRPVPIRPRYLTDPAVQPKLEQLKAGKSVLDLIRN
jgi:uncharacterized protein (TIGR02421 family)